MIEKKSFGTAEKSLRQQDNKKWDWEAKADSLHLSSFSFYLAFRISGLCSNCNMLIFRGKNNTR